MPMRKAKGSATRYHSNTIKGFNTQREQIYDGVFLLSDAYLLSCVGCLEHLSSSVTSDFNTLLKSGYDSGTSLPRLFH